MTEPEPFEPVNMPVGVLTAALQELTPRERRDPDPDLAVEEWLRLRQRRSEPTASSCRRRCIPSLADVPAEAMLDPVANTLDLREPFDERRAPSASLAAVDGDRRARSPTSPTSTTCSTRTPRSVARSTTS